MTTAIPADEQADGCSLDEGSDEMVFDDKEPEGKVYCRSLRDCRTRTRF